MKKKIIVKPRVNKLFQVNGYLNITEAIKAILSLEQIYDLWFEDEVGQVKIGYMVMSSFKTTLNPVPLKGHIYVNNQKMDNVVKCLSNENHKERVFIKVHKKSTIKDPIVLNVQEVELKELNKLGFWASTMSF